MEEQPPCLGEAYIFLENNVDGGFVPTDEGYAGLTRASLRYLENSGVPYGDGAGNKREVVCPRRFESEQCPFWIRTHGVGEFSLREPFGCTKNPELHSQLPPIADTGTEADRT